MQWIDSLVKALYRRNGKLTWGKDKCIMKYAMGQFFSKSSIWQTNSNVNDIRKIRKFYSNQKNDKDIACKFKNKGTNKWYICFFLTCLKNFWIHFEI